MCTQISSKLGVLYTVGSAILVVIQRYKARIIWKKTAPNMASQNNGFFEITAGGYNSIGVVLAGK
jgi:hypothetical protein